MSSKATSGRRTVSAIVTDVHFWVPVAVLAAGLVLLVLFGTGE